MRAFLGFLLAFADLWISGPMLLLYFLRRYRKSGGDRDRQV